ncbi:MAG: hypothetical protein QOJ11_3233 [Frankiales bacterium]|jgi:hemerythrin-like domain-containing protein|nr:hypothetical protein [Frankiales bacterium]
MTYADETRSARVPLQGEVDFTMMYASHDAFARDLHRLTDAARHGDPLDPAVLAGWQVFERQLHVHHTSEDAALWPALRRAVQHAGEVEVLDDMESEHAVLDPFIATIDEAFGAGDHEALGRTAEVLAAGLTAHMAHEEASALPLVETYLGRKGWAAFTGHIRSTQGMSGAAEFVPWLLDDAPAATRTQVFKVLPPPVKLLYRAVWLPRYRRTRHWT